MVHRGRRRPGFPAQDWHSLDAQRLIRQVVANGVPALSEAGWDDLFPGGNLGDYVAAQNAYFHRPLTAPVAEDEPVTGRYQAIVGPWTHGENVNGATVESIRLEWFDTWLKGERTGMADTATPLHLFENTAIEWAAASAGNSLTYTSAPRPRAEVLDGPSDLTVYASSTTTDTELTATLNVLSPSGAVVKQADGVLLGSQRAVDPARSWYGTDGLLLQPAHPFTQQSQRAVVPGQVTKYDISLLANFTLIPAGDRIQVVLTTQPPANFHLPLAPTPQQQANLAGGAYTVDYGPGTASVLNLPLASPGQFTASPVNWGPSS